MERRGHGLFHRHPHEDEVAGAWCPQCGGEFEAGTTWCNDCGVPLATEAPVVDAEDVVEPAPRSDRHDVVEYDLSEWTQEQLGEIESQLTAARIPHEWSARHLRVPGEQEAAVDDLVDAIDGLAVSPDDVEYEFQDWTPEQCQQLVERLLELGIACRWDGYLLGVASADEAVVDAEVLKIDPTFPVSDSGEDPPPDEPPKSGWGIAGDILGALLGGTP